MKSHESWVIRIVLAWLGLVLRGVAHVQKLALNDDPLSGTSIITSGYIRKHALGPFNNTPSGWRKRRAPRAKG